MAAARRLLVLGLLAVVYVAAAASADSVTSDAPLPAGAGRWHPPAAAALPDANALYFEGVRSTAAERAPRVRATSADAAFHHRRLPHGVDRFTVVNGARWTVNLAAPGGGRWEPGVYRSDSGADALLWGPDDVRCGAGEPGWVAIDDVAYDREGNLTRVALRASRPCAGADGDGVRRVALSWDAAVPAVTPANPVAPSHPVWRPAVADLPAADSYLLVTSTQPGADRPPRDRVVATGTGARVYAGAAPHTYRFRWSGLGLDIGAPAPLERGSYGRLQPWGAAANPVLGSLSVSTASGCATTASRLHVDDVGHTSGGALQRLTARFETRCDGGAPTRGVVRWTRPGTSPVAALPATGRPRPDVAVEPAARALTPACFFVADTSRFDDVAASNPHGPAIECLAERGIAVGTAPARFAPSAAVTRGQMAAMLARLRRDLGDTAAASTGPTPPDVTGTPHEDAIAAVLATGVARGYGDGRDAPWRPVTRGQLASAVARLVFGEDPEAYDADVYTDDDGSVHEQAIDALAMTGIATGTSSGRFDPDAPVTRAQAAALVARAAAHLVEAKVLTG